MPEAFVARLISAGFVPVKVEPCIMATGLSVTFCQAKPGWAHEAFATAVKHPQVRLAEGHVVQSGALAARFDLKGDVRTFTLEISRQARASFKQALEKAIPARVN